MPQWLIWGLFQSGSTVKSLGRMRRSASLIGFSGLVLAVLLGLIISFETGPYGHDRGHLGRWLKTSPSQRCRWTATDQSELDLRPENTGAWKCRSTGRLPRLVITELNPGFVKPDLSARGLRPSRLYWPAIIAGSKGALILAGVSFFPQLMPVDPAAAPVHYRPKIPVSRLFWALAIVSRPGRSLRKNSSSHQPLAGPFTCGSG